MEVSVSSVPRSGPELTVCASVNQVVGHNKRGTSTGFAGSMGQFGGIISALAFPKKDSPQYVPGMSVNVAFLVVGIASASWLWAWGRWENAQRDKGRRDHLLSLPQDEQDALGENHPNFRFTL